jgi:hypothetical protein
VYDSSDTVLYDDSYMTPSGCLPTVDARGGALSGIPAKILFRGYGNGITWGQWNYHVFFGNVKIVPNSGSSGSCTTTTLITTPISYRQL